MTPTWGPRRQTRLTAVEGLAADGADRVEDGRSAHRNVLAETGARLTVGRHRGAADRGVAVPHPTETPLLVS
jgi:hypothetical protein